MLLDARPLSCDLRRLDGCCRLRRRRCHRRAACRRAVLTEHLGLDRRSPPVVLLLVGCERAFMGFRRIRAASWRFLCAAASWRCPCNCVASRRRVARCASWRWRQSASWRACWGVEYRRRRTERRRVEHVAIHVVHGVKQRSQRSLLSLLRRLSNKLRAIRCTEVVVTTLLQERWLAGHLLSWRAVLLGRLHSIVTPLGTSRHTYECSKTVGLVHARSIQLLR